MWAAAGGGGGGGSRRRLQGWTPRHLQVGYMASGSPPRTEEGLARAKHEVGFGLVEAPRRRRGRWSQHTVRVL